MWWIIIAILVLIVVIYFLFAPFFVEIDSSNDLYCIRFHKLASGSILMKDTSLIVKLKIMWWTRDLNLFEHKTSKMEPQEIIGRKKRPAKYSVGKMLRKMTAILKTFRVNECRIMIDTGGMPANAILYPWFYLLSHYSGQTIMINFWGENEIKLQIENNVARILWAYISS